MLNKFFSFRPWSVKGQLFHGKVLVIFYLSLDLSYLVASHLLVDQSLIRNSELHSKVHY